MGAFRMAVAALLLPASLASVASAQVIAGRVVDPDIRAGVIGAMVVARDSTGRRRATAYTDSTGAFHIRIDRGKYNLQVTSIGYIATTTPEITVAPREQVEVEIRMSPVALNVDPLVVTARRAIPSARLEGYYRRLDRQGRFGIGRFITRAQIDSFPASFVSQYLARAGLRVVGNVGNARVYGRDCEMAIFLDGMPIERGLVNDVASPMDLEGIEIYRSAAEAPAQFVDRSGCGSIVMWTRDGDIGKFSFWRMLVAGVFSVGIAMFLMRI